MGFVQDVVKSMKECPECQTTYEDDSLKNCPADGAILSEISPKKKEGSGYNLIIGLAGGFIISAILAAIMFALILWLIGVVR